VFANWAAAGTSFIAALDQLEAGDLPTGDPD
jgi:hypothetical protein